MDVEKTMQFILEQNAKNSVQIGQLRDTALAQAAALKSHEVELRSHEADLQAHTEWKLAMSQLMQDMAAQMREGFDLVAKRQAELTEKQTEMTENFNILIRTVQNILPRLPKQ